MEIKMVVWIFFFLIFKNMFRFKKWEEERQKIWEDQERERQRKWEEEDRERQIRWEQLEKEVRSSTTCK